MEYKLLTSIAVAYFVFSRSDEPDEEIITDEWKVDWSTYMASGRDIIVAKVHLHTTQNWGRTDKNYQQPGALESIDLIHIIK